VGPENVDAILVEIQRDVVRALAANGDDETGGRLLLVNIKDTLQAELIEVEAVRLVEVCRDRLGVVVHHHRLAPQLAQRADALDGAEVELD
jgi:hypothetical protein